VPASLPDDDDQQFTPLEVFILTVALCLGIFTVYLDVVILGSHPCPYRHLSCCLLSMQRPPFRP
jgi:hypothetical protein